MLPDSDIRVRPATRDDIAQVGRLFDAYRVFYEATSDRDGATAFMQKRLERRDSAILLAEIAHRACGFVQLYPLFSSVAMERMWLLNDLYVAVDARRRGVGRALMRAAEAYARADGVRLLQLETAHTNASARALYESEGYARDTVFRTYTKTIV